MAKQSLANKYRPQTWEDVVEQGASVEILKYQIDTNTFKNCMLFCGAAGVGKTTLARIVARAINKNKGTPIEIDAASNNGVDNVRDIITRAQQKSLDSEYKCFIVDECFAEGTLIKTINGEQRIEDILPGTFVYTADGLHQVVSSHKLQTSKSHMCKIHMSNNKTVVCTLNHLILTDFGWIPAKNLKNGDLIIYDETMCDMQNNIRHNESSETDLLWELCKKIIVSESRKTPKEIIYKNVSDLWQRVCNVRQNNAILLNSMRKGAELATSQKEPSVADLYSYLCDLWQYVDRYARESDKRNLFLSLLFPIDVATSVNTLRVRSWDGTQETSIRACKGNSRILCKNTPTKSGVVCSNDTEQSLFRPEYSSEDAENERIEWESSRLERETWGKWTVHRGTTNSIQCVRRFMGIGISSENESTENQSESLSYCIQIRPCLSFDKVGDRGGWQYAQLERATIARQQERPLSERITVDSVEIYKSTNTGEPTGSNCDDTYVYDLTVAGSPTYYANNVLVHNCHSISSAGWQAFLKTLEQPPAKTIFIFCTTDPQKIPATILSRVQRFNFARISFKGICDRLRYIVECEHKEDAEIIVDDGAIDFIAKFADGGMRASIAYLDKCLSFNKHVTLERAIEALGGINYDIMFKLIDSIYDGNESEVINIIETVYREGADLKLFLKQFTNFVLDVCKYINFGNFDYIQIPQTYTSQLNNTIAVEDRNFFKQVLKSVNELNTTCKWEQNCKPLIELNMLIWCKPEGVQ